MFLKSISLSIAILLAGQAQAADPVKVKMGIVGAAADVVFWAGKERGYFRQEGLDLEFVKFDSGPRMMAPLGTGELDIVAAGHSAGFFNAVARGVGMKIVADKTQTLPGFGTQSLLVRRDHIESGRYKTLADLKGMRFASPAPGASAMTVLTKMLARGGLTMRDIDPVSMGLPQMATALTNKAIDAALPNEPGVTLAMRTGLVERVLEDYDVYPEHQIAVIFYSSQFMRDKKEAASGFLRAYLRGVRDYNDALVNGRLAGPKGDALVEVLTRNGPSTDPAFYRSFAFGFCHPDGKLHLPSLEEDLKIFRDEGLIEGNVTLAQAIDTSFIEAALKQAGPYKPGAQ